MNYRIEVRADFTGTEEDARKTAEAMRRAADQVDGVVSAEITAIFDENWEEI